MDTIKQIIVSKPRKLLILTAFYVIILGVLKWKMSPDIETVLYLLGSILGVYFMDFSEFIFNIKPSPFRSIVFAGLYCIVSFFIVTSSGNMFAVGLVLSLFLQLLFMQISEWNIVGNLNSWYGMVDRVASPNGQITGVFLQFIGLVFESIIFIR